MMIDGRFLQEIKARWEAIRDMTIDITRSREGHTKLRLRDGATPAELRVTRDGEPATEGDVIFVGHAFSDIPRLLVALESGSHLLAEQAGDLGSRVLRRVRARGRRSSTLTVEQVDRTSSA